MSDERVRRLKPHSRFYRVKLSGNRRVVVARLDDGTVSVAFERLVDRKTRNIRHVDFSVSADAAEVMVMLVSRVLYEKGLEDGVSKN